METLPIELISHIFEGMEEFENTDVFNRVDGLAAPLTANSISNICNARAVSQKFDYGGKASFAKVVGGREISLTKNSITCLNHLLADPRLAVRITSLIFNNDVPFLVAVKWRHNYLERHANTAEYEQLTSIISSEEIKRQNDILKMGHEAYLESGQALESLRCALNKCLKLESIQHVASRPRQFAVDWPNAQVGQLISSIVGKDHTAGLHNGWPSSGKTSSVNTLYQAMQGAALNLTALSVRGQELCRSQPSSPCSNLAPQMLANLKTLDLEFQSSFGPGAYRAALIDEILQSFRLMPCVETFRLQIAQYDRCTNLGKELLKALGVHSHDVFPKLRDVALIGHLDPNDILPFTSARKDTLRRLRLQFLGLGWYGDLVTLVHQRERKLERLLRDLVGRVNLDFLAIAEPERLASAQGDRTNGCLPGRFDRRARWEPLLSAVARSYLVVGHVVSLRQIKANAWEYSTSGQFSDEKDDDHGRAARQAFSEHPEPEQIRGNWEWSSCYHCRCHRSKVAVESDG